MAQVLDAEVTYASVPAWDGLVGVSPSRAPLLLKLGDGTLRLDFPEGGSRYFFLAGGFAQMKDNRLSLVTEEAIPAQEIVRTDVEAALREAQARVALSDDDVQARRRKINRGKTLLQLASRS
jgi:F-type H+-transporting ATPase subunit epsilon